jgi:hypothetical protein
MPEEMARDARRNDNASALECLPDDPPERTIRQRIKWWSASQKDLTTRTLRAPALQVGHHGLADLVREG